MRGAPHRMGWGESQRLDVNLASVDMAGAGGFEPPNGGIKIRCLTTWRRPNGSAVTAFAIISPKRGDHSRVAAGSQMV
jgi:hypothetical protein